MIRTDAELKAIIDAARDGSPPWWTGPELENILKDIIDSKQSIAPLLDDATFTVNGPEAFDPVAGTNILTLPSYYINRKIRVSRNGFLFTKYNRTSTGITLTQPGDVWMPDEEIVIQNY